MDKFYVVGFDQATTTGYGVFLVDTKMNLTYNLIESGKSTLKKSLRVGDWFKDIRLHEPLLERIYNDYNPTYVIIEGVQLQANVDVFRKLCILQAYFYFYFIERGITPVIMRQQEWRGVLGINTRKSALAKQEAIRKVHVMFGKKVTGDEAEGILIPLAFIKGVLPYEQIK